MNKGQKKLCKTVSKHFGMSPEALEALMEKKAYSEHMRLYEEATRPGYCPFCKVTYSRTFWGDDCPAQNMPKHAFYDLNKTSELFLKVWADAMEVDKKFLEGISWEKTENIEKHLREVIPSHLITED